MVSQVRRVRLSIIVLVALLALASCGKSGTLPDGFDIKAWKADVMGCQGHRSTMLPLLLDGEDGILGIRETKFIQLLGKPDKNELKSRNQKVMVYHIDPASSCTSYDKSLKKALQIRFNAVGLSSEVILVE